MESGSEILYLHQDMRELDLYSTVGTVISVCDSVNYILEEEELLQVFRLVNNYLYPGGIFIFVLIQIINTGKSSAIRRLAVKPGGLQFYLGKLL